MTTPAQPERTGLRIGFVPGVTLTKWRRIWEERFRRVPLQVTEVLEADQRRALGSGQVDMCFVRLPIDTAGLHTIALYEEQPVVWMAKEFLLAALDEVTAEDMAEFRIVEDYSPESIDLAVYSAAALRVPLSVARTQSRKDMVHRPVVDADPTTIALAWRVDNDNEWIDEFIGVVRGRTANSSRTAKEREKSGKPAKPQTKKPSSGNRPAGQKGRRPRRR
ncbi:LysR substrate-binding domain-containing protein [Tessaracoccus terricola]